MSLKLFLFFGASLSLLSSCYVNWSRPDRHVAATLSGTPKISNVNFTDFEFDQAVMEKAFPKEYQEKLILSLRSSSVDVVNENPEFEIHLDELFVEISTKKEAVKDVNSSDNGKVFELKKMEYTIRGRIVRVSNGEESTWAAQAETSETLEKKMITETSALGFQSSEYVYNVKALAPNAVEELLDDLAIRSRTVIVKHLIRAVNQKE